MSDAPSLILPDWPAPPNVRAFISTRNGGVSRPPFASLNLGDHVCDDSSSVAKNRAIFAEYCSLDNDRIAWLRQVHGIGVAHVDDASCRFAIEADAAITQQARVGCVVMTADCMPVLFCDEKGTHVAAAHAGWRGMLNGVLEATVAAFHSSTSDTSTKLMAYLGPTISKTYFEVGSEVREAFMAKDERFAEAFKQGSASDHASGSVKYLCDLYLIARIVLAKVGVSKIYGGEYCTFGQDALFYSYRRDGEGSGRLASMIYLDS